ncbi:MAG: hypothetical protein ACLVL7_06090 [Anaerotruncus massiliensis (ex Togo et al. 2019)]
MLARRGDAELTGQARIMHFGSVSLTDEPSRSATLAAVRAAKEAGAVVSYDPSTARSCGKAPARRSGGCARGSPSRTS